MDARTPKAVEIFCREYFTWTLACRAQTLTTTFFLMVTQVDQKGLDFELIYCSLGSIEDNLFSV